MKTAPRFVLLLTCGLLIASLFGCTPARPPIRIAISAWAGVEPAELAAQLGLYQKRGVQVEVKRFSAYSDSLAALRDEKVDAGMHTLDDSIRSYAAGKDVRVVLLTDYSNGADGVVVKAGINSLADLKGKKIGVEIGTVGHFSLLKILEIAKLTQNDVSILSIPAWEIQQHMIAGDIDAGVTWEPFLSDTAQKIGGKVLTTSRDYPETIVTTMTFNASVVAERPEDVQKVVAAFFDAVEYMKQNPQDAYARMGKAEGISQEEFAASVQGVQFLDLKANAGLFGAQENGKIFATTQAIDQFLADQKVIQNAGSTSKLLEPGFVLKLADK